MTLNDELRTNTDRITENNETEKEENSIENSSPPHHKTSRKLHIFKNIQGFCAWCKYQKNILYVLSLLLIAFLLWGILYGIVPDLVKPRGKLFDFTVLVILAYISGILLLKITTLPALIGMLFMGIFMQNMGWVNLEGQFSRVTSELRRIALVIILTRAGLSLDQSTMRRLFVAVLKLGLIPWVAECIAVAILGHFFLKLPWDWAFLLSSIIASVSPAVVVPCFISLQNRGYGVEKGIPTLILAAASIDDTTSIAVYGIISSIMFTESSLTNTILQVPLTLIGGIGFGVLWGYLLLYIPSKDDTLVGPLRIALLFLGGYMSVLGSSIVGYSGAGPLALISAAFVSNYNWSKQGWNVKNNPVTQAYKFAWHIFEPILFALTGIQVKIFELDLQIVGIGTACLYAAVFFHIIVTAIICFGSNFNLKEKLFIGLSWMAKATVQAALGPLAIETVKSIGGTDEQMNNAKIVMMICILSIALTAPIGAILISVTGPKLLEKAKDQNCVECGEISKELNKCDTDLDNHDNETQRLNA